MMHHPDGYTIRPATTNDITHILALRRLMFEEMGVTEQTALDRMVESAHRYLLAALPAGQFYAWMIEDAAGNVAASGAAVIHASPPTVSNLDGRSAYVMNVCTYPAHRRRGLARWLMEVIHQWAAAQGILVMTLHASEAGKSLYESMGFVATNEMRLIFAS